MPRTAFRLLMTIIFAFAPTVVFAHPGHGEGSNLLSGFVHPFGGIDHLLAMTAVGLFAAHLGGRALWAVPGSFIAVMAFGGIIGAAGISLPFAETAIALSVMVLGLVIAARVSPPVLAAMALVGLFAVFHGHAHGTEAPDSGSALAYGLGFMVASATLHGIGITLGVALQRFAEVPRRRAMQACGVAIALVGAGLTISLV